MKMNDWNNHHTTALSASEPSLTIHDCVMKATKTRKCTHPTWRHTQKHIIMGQSKVNANNDRIKQSKKQQRTFRDCCTMNDSKLHVKEVNFNSLLFYPFQTEQLPLHHCILMNTKCTQSSEEKDKQKAGRGMEKMIARKAGKNAHMNVKNRKPIDWKHQRNKLNSNKKMNEVKSTTQATPLQIENRTKVSDLIIRKKPFEFYLLHW